MFWDGTIHFENKIYLMSCSLTSRSVWDHAIIENNRGESSHGGLAWDRSIS